jgi:plastocyanin
MIDVPTLAVGDKVTYTAEGRTHELTVQTAPDRFGSHDEKTVTVGYGPGRWNRSVSNSGQRMGFYALTAVQS